MAVADAPLVLERVVHEPLNDLLFGACGQEFPQLALGAKIAEEQRRELFKDEHAAAATSVARAARLHDGPVLRDDLRVGDGEVRAVADAGLL